jgi:hypothetical protein
MDRRRSLEAAAERLEGFARRLALPGLAGPHRRDRLGDGRLPVADPGGPGPRPDDAGVAARPTSPLLQRRLRRAWAGAGAGRRLLLRRGPAAPRPGPVRHDRLGAGHHGRGLALLRTAAAGLEAPRTRGTPTPTLPRHAGDRPGLGNASRRAGATGRDLRRLEPVDPELRVRPDAAGTGLALVWPTGDEDPLTALSATPASAWATTRPAPSGPGSRLWSRAAPYSWWCPAGRSTGSTDAAHPTT